MSGVGLDVVLVDVLDRGLVGGLTDRRRSGGSHREVALPTQLVRRALRVPVTGEVRNVVLGLTHTTNYPTLEPR